MSFSADLNNSSNYTGLTQRNPVKTVNHCFYSSFQIDELHRHNQNLVGTLHKGVPTVVDRHEKCCNT
ncbi:MAG: hypothetical protein MGU50_21120 [Trichodesmium sp. MAG_R02]|nr:hypothetical protein [Trichodesmium sp. MAG_R02]